MSSYSEFIKSKRAQRKANGFEPLFLPECLKPFQRHLSEWNIRLGRGAIYADCGLGKSLLSLVFAENCVRKTNKPALILTPLAVAQQFVTEAEKFGMEAFRTQNGKIRKGINVTNYHRLHHYNPDDFSCVITDESSILKGFDRKWRKDITAFMHKIPYRMLGTATPAPNDFMELGTSSEALGVMGRNQMLAMFFVNDCEQTNQWRLKGHAKRKFWQWMGTWARACRRPSDLGDFSDKGYVLPKLNLNKVILPSTGPMLGFLPKVAKTMEEQRKENRKTINERCEKVAEMAPTKRPCIVWCHLNDESNLLAKSIPGAVEVSGSMSDEEKEERLVGFSSGQIRVLITKPKIAGFGLNWQHCSDVFYFPSHSHEQWYQAIRRCWRFGQEREVTANIVTTEAAAPVLENMVRKERQSDEMYAGIVANMNRELQGRKELNGQEPIKLPKWMIRS